MIRKLFTGLLVCLGVLFIGFSNAGYLTGTEGLYIFDTLDTQVLGDYTYKFDIKGTPYTNDNKVAFKRFYYYQTRKVNFQYSWKNGQLYFWSNYIDGSNVEHYKQGFIDKWCVSDNLNYCLDVNNANNRYTYTTQNVLNYQPVIKQVIFGQGSDSWNRASGTNTHTYYCLDDGDFYYCASCLAESSSNFICKSGLTGNSLNLTVGNVQEYFWDNSPIAGDTHTNLNDSDFEYIESKLTNYDVLVGCEKVGLEYNYCKGGFNSDVLFPDSGFPSLSNYVRGQGVDIITMYNMYSGTYNSPNKFMQAISKGYNIHDFDWFRGKPLALYMFAVQYFPNKDDLQFSFMDIYNYCVLVNSVEDGLENNKYIGDDLQVCKNQARLDKVNNYYDGITTDGTGAMSVFGNGTGFTSPDEFFGKIYSFFNTNLIYDGESFPGVLPPVIYFFMIAIIFIRIISRSNG